MIYKHILLIMFLNELNFILLPRVKWFQVLLRITNNLIKHQSFVYTVKWSNISISNYLIKHKLFVCTQFKCQAVLFDLKIELYQVLLLQVRVTLGAMAMKGYSNFPKAPALLELHHQIV